MSKVYIALGSNVGNRSNNIALAISLLSDSISDIQQAPLYNSKAFGYTDQPDFLNTALAGNTDLAPLSLLEFFRECENTVGRIPRFKWGPREIDIDLIFYDDLVMTSEDLTVPHPNFRERLFVLKPLFDLNPDLRDPVTNKTLRQLLKELPDDDSLSLA